METDKNKDKETITDKDKETITDKDKDKETTIKEQDPETTIAETTWHPTHTDPDPEMALLKTRNQPMFALAAVA